MSLYTDLEICVGCKHSVFFNCGKCLKECKINAEHLRKRTDGTCLKYLKEVKDE